MLQAFTWQQFLIAALIFSLVWLLVVFLVFYRKAVFKLLSGDSKVEPLKHAWQDDFEQPADDDLMGKTVQPDGVNILGQDDFGFAPKDLPEQAEVDSGEVLQTELFDLMENVKPLFEAPELDKAGLIEAVNEEVRHYPKLMNSPLLETFYLLVAEQVLESGALDFNLKPAELQAAL
ncbi:hypothetical protein AB6735_24325 [Mucilaginibacter sp. RCC_168]|uniref:hypothetical protein n=1 Tax=Mucilaginibacter sp. RCC_168 TaxID=3239221 RepID=UPI003524C0B5